MICGLVARFEPPVLDLRLSPPKPTASVGSVTIRKIDPNEIATDEEVQEMLDRIFD